MNVCCSGFPSLRMFHVILVVTWILGSGVDPNDILSCFWEVKISPILPWSPSKVICQTFRCTVKMCFFHTQNMAKFFPCFCKTTHFQHHFFKTQTHLLTVPLSTQTPRGFLNFRSSHWAREFVRTFHGQTLTRRCVWVFPGQCRSTGIMKGLLTVNPCGYDAIWYSEL